MARRVATALLFGAVLAFAAAHVQAQDEEYEEEESYAQILAHKNVDYGNDHGYLVSNKNFTVTYTLFNIGNGAALDVSLKDVWSEDSFTVLSGSASQEWAQIEAGGNESVSVTLVPKVAGQFSPGRADVEYRYGAEDSVEKSVKSSTFGVTEVLTPEEFERRTTTYFVQKTTFLVLSAGPVLVPFAMYWYAKAEAEKALKAR